MAEAKAAAALLVGYFTRHASDAPSELPTESQVAAIHDVRREECRRVHVRDWARQVS